jgi:hypothetical protein
MLGTQEGQMKISTVFLEISLPDFPSSAPLPLHSSADATFVTAGVGHPGPITFPDRDGTAWTAEPYGEWFVQTGVTSTRAPVTSFNNSLSFIAPAGPVPTAYKAWRHGGIFTVVKLAPGPDDKICDPGSDGLYHGDTSRCHSYSTDRLQMYDTNGGLIQVSLSQRVKLDSASYAAFTTGVSQSVAIQAQGIPAPNLTATSSLPAGFTLGPPQQVSPGVMRGSLIYNGGGTPGNYLISLLLSNEASETYIDYTVALGTTIKITSPPAIKMTYGEYTDFLVYATGTPVSYVVDDIFPAGITVTDNGNGSASIRGVPNRAAKSYCLANLNNPGNQCGIVAKNTGSSDFQKPTITVINPPPASITSEGSTLFLAGEPGAFAITQNGPLTKDGKGFYRVVDRCTARKPAWLTQTLLPSGNLVLGGTPPLNTPPQTHPLLNFGLALNGEPDPPQSCAPNFLLTVDLFPRFVGPSHLMVQPGQTVPDNKFQSANPFTLFRMDGTLPAGVTFHNDGDGFSFRGTLASDVPTGDYKLYITATSATGTKASEVFHFLVGESPSDAGPRTFNLVINTPVRLIINPQGFPKQEIADAGLPGMTSSMSGVFPAGITQSEGMQPGSILLEGTPAELFTPPVPGLLVTSNGVGPNLAAQYYIRVIQPGDINADRRVNCSDTGMVKAALNKKRGFPGYDYLADVNNDGSVDVRDLALVSKNLPAGTRCP